MKLTFIISGVQKGGTTALYYFLREHPRLFLPETKELHFFDNERVDWSAPDYDGLYHAHFAEAPAGAVCGEATPIYAFWPPAMQRMCAYNPRMKIILSLRDPVARAYSQWRMETVRGFETLPFSEAIRGGRLRLTQAAPLANIGRVYSYVERSLYAAQLARVFEKFPRRQVLLLSHDELRRDHTAVLDKICDFLEIERFVTYPPPEVIFSYGGADLAPMSPADAAYLRNIFEPDLAAIRRYGIDLGARVASAA